MGVALVAVKTRLKGAPESLYCVGRSCIRWQLLPVPDGLGEERFTEGLTALSFLIKAIFASSPAFVGLDILAGVSKFFYNRRYFLNFRRCLKN